jgi:hypothetical protein
MHMHMKGMYPTVTPAHSIEKRKPSAPEHVDGSLRDGGERSANPHADDAAAAAAPLAVVPIREHRLGKGSIFFSRPSKP